VGLLEDDETECAAREEETDDDNIGKEIGELFPYCSWVEERGEVFDWLS